MNTTSARLQTVEQIFHAALELPPQQLDAFLNERCAGDELLRREVEALLVSNREAGNFIEAPVVTFDASLLDEEQADRLIGQTIGHYEITGRIGGGGMGAVYLARRADQAYEKVVAIKLIKRGMDTDAVLRHFHNERRILAGFDHPNIARLLDGGTEGGLPYFVMEYVEGLPIDEYCDRCALSVTARLELFRQVCGAVSYAHRHAVIHRDIKPSNILVSADGEPKLLDFGIARILQPGAGTEPAATMMSLRVMTPEYASPEQTRGEALTTASDVYSLGMVLYRLLTGRLPYRLPGQTTFDLARTIGETEPQRPSAAIAAGSETASPSIEGGAERLQRRLRGDLDNIVLMALRKEPERRYPSVEQFSEDIRRHLETLPVLARPDTLAYRSAKFMRRNTAAAIAAALVVLSLLGGIVATTWQAQRARAQEALAQSERARAERRFNEVRELAHSVLFDYHDAIKDLPGATAVRERLVKDGLAYLDSLARDAEGDPELQRELAAAYDRLGDVRGQVYSTASLGDAAGATESYVKALKMREALVATSPQDFESRRDLANSYTKVGGQLIETNEAARGLEYLRKALEVYGQLLAEQPENSAIRHKLAVTHNDVGVALEVWGDTAGALNHHRQALAFREELLASDTANQKYRRGLSITYTSLGRAMFRSGDIKGGLESNRKALALCEALLVEDPSNTNYRHLLAHNFQNDGDYRATLHDVTGALQSFRTYLAFMERLLADDPRNVAAHAALAYPHKRIGDLLAESGDYSQALTHTRRALAIYEEMSADSPEDFRLRSWVPLVRASVARLHARLGQQAAALADSAKAIALLNATVENPTDPYQASNRGSAYMHLGEAYAALARSRDAAMTEQRHYWGTAREMYVQSLKIWQDMTGRGILTQEDAEKPQQVAQEIAKCDASLRKLPS